jgi:hypothetical protein
MDYGMMAIISSDPFAQLEVHSPVFLHALNIVSRNHGGSEPRCLQFRLQNKEAKCPSRRFWIPGQYRGPGDPVIYQKFCTVPTGL